MFVIVLTYVKPTEQIDELIPDHVAFLDRFYEEGTFIASGRRVPRTGGVIISKGDSVQAVWEIIKEDPFYKAGVAEYEVIEFTPSKYQPGFSRFLSVC